MTNSTEQPPECSHTLRVLLTILGAIWIVFAITAGTFHALGVEPFAAREALAVAA